MRARACAPRGADAGRLSRRSRSSRSCSARAPLNTRARRVSPIWRSWRSQRSPCSPSGGWFVVRARAGRCWSQFCSRSPGPIGDSSPARRRRSCCRASAAWRWASCSPRSRRRAGCPRGSSRWPSPTRRWWSSELLQRPNNALNAARPVAGLPQLQSAVFGSAVMGYGDIFIAATLGGLLALRFGRVVQRRAAVLTAALALASDLLFFAINELPATVPVALALVAVLLRRQRQGRGAEPARPAQRQQLRAAARSPGAPLVP